MGLLARKLRDARRVEVEAGGFVFILRRPTDLEFIDLRGSAGSDRLLKFLVDWRGVKESDIVEHGDPHEAKFDAEDAREWLSDRMDLFGAITTGLITAYEGHTAAIEEKLKNLTPGSSPQPPDSSQAISPTT